MNSCAKLDSAAIRPSKGRDLMSPQRKKRVGVVGLGYVGLPLAIRAAEVGYEVVGVDADASRVACIRSGSSPIDDVSDDRLRTLLQAHRRLTVTDDYQNLTAFDIAIITVPTPLKDRMPDLSYVEAATVSVAPHVRPGCLVVLESTTYPGTTEELVAPLLAQGSGLRPGRDFHLGFSPERIDPGNFTWTLETTPKVVSGMDDASLQAVTDFYADITDRCVQVSSTRAAELAKLLENTFRHVNIALVNEMAMFARELDIDIWEVVEAAASKPFGFMKFLPGPGVGGHCLPIDPAYLSWQVRRTTGRPFRFVELACDINDHMPDYVVQRLTTELNLRSLPVHGTKVLVLGLAYKANTGDARESPAVRIIALLQKLGADVCVIDPLVDPGHFPAGVIHAALDGETLAGCDAAVLVTDHDCFDYGLVQRTVPLVLDCRHRMSGTRVVNL